jgi:hypothetical protein
MRASRWLLGLATTLATAGAVVSGCGGSTSGGNNNTAKDSGGAADVTAADVVDSGKPDVSEAAAVDVVVQDTAPACSIDANITSLNIPDAQIGDSSASTDGCYSCIQTTCPSQLSACNADCTCNNDVGTLLTCIGSGTSVITCGTPIISGGASDTAGLLLISCVAGSAFPGGSGPGCLAACGYSVATGPEGGPGDGGDGGAEQ